MDGAHVVCSGWLRKAPREDKCGPFIWRRHWFVLRSGKMSGDPDVVEYYKNDRSKKPLRSIDLSFCHWVDAKVNLHSMRQPDGFVFAIETSERPFYLLAETEADMNKWVDGICRILGFVEINWNTGKTVMQHVNGKADLEHRDSGARRLTDSTLTCSSSGDPGPGPGTSPDILSVDVGDGKKTQVVSPCQGPAPATPHGALCPEPKQNPTDGDYVDVDFESGSPSWDCKGPSSSLSCDSAESHYIPMEPEYVPMDPRGVPGFQDPQSSMEEEQAATHKSQGLPVGTGL